MADQNTSKGRLPDTAPGGMTRRTPLLLGLMLVALLAVNAMLVVRVVYLTRAIDQVKSEHVLRPGAAVPAFTAKDVFGRAVSITYSHTGRPTVIYVFSPTCGWCRKNERNIHELAQSLRSRYNLVAVSMSEHQLREYLSAHPLDCPVLANLPPDIIKAYRFGGTPTTIVVSQDGRVLKIWFGAFAGETQDQIEAYFGIELPGIA